MCTLPTYNDITWMFEPNHVPETKLVPCFAWAVSYIFSGDCANVTDRGGGGVYSSGRSCADPSPSAAASSDPG